MVGAVLRTRGGVRPLFVSLGHRMDLPGGIEMILCLSRGYRLPDPVQRAHLALNSDRREGI